MMGVALASAARADFPVPRLSLQDDVNSVYAPPSPASENEGLNAGGVNLDIEVRYMTDYEYRGIERFDSTTSHEDSANLQWEGKLDWNLGKLPHPFIGLFVNVAESDPISNFQEVRPFFGGEWNLRPFILSTGHTTYIFPDRKALETSEVWGKVELDDSYFFNSDRPLFSPYIMGAYDYDKFHGWYIEAGFHHDFIFEDIGLTLRAEASVGYGRGYELFRGPTGKDTGFQHYQIGMVGSYSLNQLFHFSARYGEWKLKAYINYTDGIDNLLHCDTQLWGGAGIEFRY